MMLIRVLFGRKSRAIFAFNILAILLLNGCSQHAEVTSPESQTLILRFYTACNTKSIERLQVAAKIYQELKSQQKITEREQKSFDKISLLAQGGRWEEAADLAYAFSEAQVR